jgi:tetratricopeptide (TPR) repeat protein
MLVQAAESRFARGLQALEAGRGLEALALFEAAIELERRLGSRTPQARYLSFYGLCLALEADRPRDGAELCRQAIGLEFYNADLSWNYGRVLLALERRKEAYQAFLKGLAVQKNHQGILREISRMGWRKRPIVPFLDRKNPVNIALGKMLRESRKDGAKRPA